MAEHGPPVPAQTGLSENEREDVRRAVHRADDRLARSFALLDVMAGVANRPEAPEVEVQAAFIRWADEHREASVEVALDAIDRILAARQQLTAQTGLNEDEREAAHKAALEAAAIAPVRNRNEAAFVAHLLSDMDVLRLAVDAALDTLAARRQPSAEVLLSIQGPLQSAKDLTDASMGHGKDRDDCTPAEMRARGVWHALHYMERRLTGWDAPPDDPHADAVAWEKTTADFDRLARQQPTGGDTATAVREALDEVERRLTAVASDASYAYPEEVTDTYLDAARIVRAVRDAADATEGES